MNLAASVPTLRGVPLSTIHRGMLPPGSLLVTMIHSTGFISSSPSSPAPSCPGSPPGCCRLKDEESLFFLLPWLGELLPLPFFLGISRMSSIDSYCPRVYPCLCWISGCSHGLEIMIQLRPGCLVPPACNPESELIISATKSRGAVGLGNCAETW